MGTTPSTLYDRLKTGASNLVTRGQKAYSDAVAKVQQDLKTPVYDSTKTSSAPLIHGFENTSIGKAVSSKVGSLIDDAKQEASNIVTDPHARTNFLVGMVAPGGEPDEMLDKEVMASAKKGVKLPKGQMKPEDIQAEIKKAGAEGKTLYLTYNKEDWDEPKVYHVEPYSFRGEGNQRFMAYDRLQKGIRSFNLDDIVNAKMHPDLKFKPQVDKNGNPWDVEIGTPESIIKGQGMNYKGELMKDSGVHMFEHPDHPGRTMSLKESDVTPRGVRDKFASKQADFGEPVKSSAVVKTPPETAKLAAKKLNKQIEMMKTLPDVAKPVGPSLTELKWRQQQYDRLKELSKNSNLFRTDAAPKEFQTRLRELVSAGIPADNIVAGVKAGLSHQQMLDAAVAGDTSLQRVTKKLDSSNPTKKLLKK